MPCVHSIISNTYVLSLCDKGMFIKIKFLKFKIEGRNYTSRLEISLTKISSCYGVTNIPLFGAV